MQEKEDWRLLFREAGRRGGLARAKALTPERRREIAQRAGRARHKRCMDCGATFAECECPGETAA